MQEGPPQEGGGADLSALANAQTRRNILSVPPALLASSALLAPMPSQAIQGGLVRTYLRLWSPSSAALRVSRMPGVQRLNSIQLPLTPSDPLLSLCRQAGYQVSMCCDATAS